MPGPNRILVCHCRTAQVLNSPARDAVLAALRAAGAELDEVADLCHLAADHDPRLARAAASDRPCVLACHERAVRWLFHAAGADLPADARLFDLRGGSAGEILDALGVTAGGDSGEVCAAASEATANATQAAVPAAAKQPEPAPGAVSAAAWPAWFPVMDYSRCQNCKQCLSFCLFGVYAEAADGSVRVQNPRNCKPNCPACARVCPHLAIIFPKYHSSPINGDRVEESAEGKAPGGVDLPTLLGGDPYSLLRQRAARPRFATQAAPAQGAGEPAGDPCQRLEALRRMQKELDIPSEVLMSLRVAAPAAGAADAAPRPCQCECQSSGERKDAAREGEARESTRAETDNAEATEAPRDSGQTTAPNEWVAPSVPEDREGPEFPEDGG